MVPIRFGLTAQAGVKNLLDRNYYYTAGYPEAGRNWYKPFLSPAERDQAAAEWLKLQSVATAPDWLAAQTLAFAQRHPQDPRVPEALALVVRATRFGCTGAANGAFSQRAFQLLHRKYANTGWAQKTPYWFQ